MPRVLISSLHNRAGKFALVFSLLLVCTPALRSQFESFTQHWQWVTFRTESGLPSNQVSSLVETNDGSVWVSTSLGLARFDGFQWHAVPDTGTSFKTRPIAIVAGGDSSIYALFDSMVYRCSASGISPLNLTIEGKSVFAVGIVFTSQSGLIIQTKKGELLSFRDNGLRRLSIPSTFSSFGGPQIFSPGKGNIFWISTVAGLYRWNGSSWEIKLPARNNYAPIQSLVEQSDGTAFVSRNPRELRGIFKFRPDGTSEILQSEGKEIIRTTDISPTGDIIDVYESGDIRIFHNGVWSSLMVIPAQLRNVLFIRFRPNGDLWVGSETGLFLHKISSRRWTYWKHPFPNIQNNVHEIVRTADSSVWLGTEGGIEIHRKDGSLEEISAIGGKKISVVTGLCEDDNGNIWVSSGSDFTGTYRWDKKRWEYFGPGQGLNSKFHRIRKDKEGRIWFLGLGETVDGPQPGAWMYDGTSFAHWGVKEGVLHNRIYSFESARDGTLWFGTFIGVSRWKNGVWKQWKSNVELRTTGGIFTMSLGPDGSLWFGERGTSIGYIDTLDAVHYLSLPEGFGNASVWDVRFDGRGTLWVSTHSGLLSYANGVWSAFTLSTGLNSLNLWPILPAGINIYIGSDGDGVDILRLDEANDPPPRITCDEPAVRDDRVSVHWECYPYWGEVPRELVETRYRIDNTPWSEWDTKRELVLAGLAIGDHAIQFQVKNLFGRVDTAGIRKTFSITPPLYARPSFALPVGLLSIAVIYLGFVLVMRKRNHSRALRESETRLRMITDTTSSAIFIVREGKIRFINPVMETITGLTRAELMERGLNDLVHPEQQDRLTALQSDLPAPAGALRKAELRIVRKDGTERWLDCIARQVLYDGRPALLGSAFDISDRKEAEAKLIAYQEQLSSLAAELSSTEERERRQMATYLHDTIAQALAFSKIKLETLMDMMSPSRYDDLLEEIHRFLNQSIENTQSLTFELSPPILYELSLEDSLKWLTNQIQTQHRLAVQFYNDAQPKQVSDEIKTVLFHTVRELLTNIVKHAHATSVHLKLSRQGDELQVILEDDGKGFDTAVLLPGGTKNHRFGLFHIHERIKSVNGKIDVSSEPGQGTYVSLSVPLIKQPGESS